MIPNILNVVTGSLVLVFVSLSGRYHALEPRTCFGVAIVEISLIRLFADLRICFSQKSGKFANSRIRQFVLPKLGESEWYHKIQERQTNF